MDYSQYTHLEFRRKLLKLIGAEVSIRTPEDVEVGNIQLKGFKLKEEIRVFTDATQTTEVATIKARSIIDFGATYDVTVGGQPAFAMRRKGLRSTFVRDSWEILGPGDVVIGSLIETSGNMAIIRRWLGAILDIFDLIFAFIPQTYDIHQIVDGADIVTGNILHRRNPIVTKLALDTSMAAGKGNPLVNIIATTMLCIVDSNKN